MTWTFPQVERAEPLPVAAERPKTADAPANFSAFVEEVELVRAAVAGRSLDDTFVHPQLGQEMNLRWVDVHLIEEYARHNGHADLIRERVDGVTGE